MRSWLHTRRLRRARLLAVDALEPADRVEMQTHIASCARCRAELESARSLLDLVSEDPVRSAAPPISPAEMTARVATELAARSMRSEAPPRLAARSSLPLWAAAAVVALAMGVALAPGPPEEVAMEVMSASSDELIRRLERNLSRRQAAGYLDDARDLLVAVHSARDCPEQHEHVDVAEEADRSRRLLARRPLSVDLDRTALVSAETVLDDVEGVLREVAALDQCVRPDEIETIRDEIDTRNLMLRISLARRELRG